MATDNYYSGFRADHMDKSSGDQAIPPSSAYAQRWCLVSSTKMDKNSGGEAENSS